MPAQRLARASEAPRIAELMRASTLELFPRFYDARQTASAAIHIANIDLQLIEDGTYFVHGQGFSEFVLGATLPGVPLYRAFGFREVEPFVLTMPDGVCVAGVEMRRAIGA